MATHPAPATAGIQSSVVGVRRRDWAGRAALLWSTVAGVTRVSNVKTHARDQLAQPEDVSVEVEADRPSPHAARAEVS